MSSTPYVIAVRALCEFVARRGDLDWRFTPAPTAQQGIQGHQLVASRRGPAYQAELALSGTHRHLTVRGRADGFDPDAGRLEEIKTHKGEVARVPAHHQYLHWAQAKVYGWLLCQARGLETLAVALVYLDVTTNTETVLTQACTAAELRAHFESVCEAFLAWAAQELAHRARRDAALAALTFPQPEFRAGQRLLAESVYRAAAQRRVLLAQAPTGIGKTVGTVFPMLKACPTQRLDKVFFLTAKRSGALPALQALHSLRPASPEPWLRVLELRARESACEHPDRACHGESCPLARGFHDRLPAARAQACASAVLDHDTTRAVALEHAVCPYYLAQEMARWSDVVVADLNHYFDHGGLLHGLTLANDWRVGLLVDEAHNLIDRARAMVSGRLDRGQWREARRLAPAPAQRAMDRLSRVWPPSSAMTKGDGATTDGKGPTLAYRVLEAPPSGLASALQTATATLGEALAEPEQPPDPRLLDWYFEALRFSRLLEGFGDHSLFDLTDDSPVAREGAPDAPPHGAQRPGRRGTARARRLPTLGIRNVVPAGHLAPRWRAAHTAVLFSATLTPAHYYLDLLGLPEDTVCLDVPAPFRAEQLRVRVVPRVSTRWRDRAASLAPIADLIATHWHEHPGNYLAFFSSFEYLAQAARTLAERHPHIPQWAQARSREPAEREAFLGRFVSGGRGVGFAVLGGSFGEGIDLPGDRLIGAFIATLGLPQFNPMNEALCARLQALFGARAGHDYAYRVPGLRKVVQAAGRVIRTPQDRGSVHLIDDRFAHPQVRRLLPDWWRVEILAATPQTGCASVGAPS